MLLPNMLESTLYTQANWSHSHTHYEHSHISKYKDIEGILSRRYLAPILIIWSCNQLKSKILSRRYLVPILIIWSCN